jgi:hypothetical protein
MIMLSKNQIPLLELGDYLAVAVLWFTFNISLGDCLCSINFPTRGKTPWGQKSGLVLPTTASSTWQCLMQSRPSLNMK